MRRETWLEQLAHELAAHDVAAADVAAIVVEADGHLAESGEPPLAIFGTPARYAATLVEALGAARAATAPGAPRLTATGIAKRYGRRPVLDGVDLELRAGEAVLLMGANGSGKSTLLRILAGLAAPDAGRVAVHGSVGYAPQSGGLFEHLLPVEHFVLFGRGRGLARAAAVRDGRRLAEQLGWDPVDAPVAGALSGGLRQKLSVVLAALGEPDVLLLDEPYQGLDLPSVQRFWELLWTWRDSGRCALVASHAHDAIERADAVVELGVPAAA
jgi:ABC-type multidrug transport system ATPase subunit